MGDIGAGGDHNAFARLTQPGGGDLQVQVLSQGAGDQAV